MSTDLVRVLQKVVDLADTAGSGLPGAGASRLRLALRGSSASRGARLVALEIIDAQVRDAVRRRGIDPAADPGAVRGLVEEVVRAYDERSLTGAVPVLEDVARTTQHVYDAVAGYGLLQRYFDDPTVEEIWINEPGRVFVARRGRTELTTTILTAQTVRDLVERMLKPSGRRLDLSSPFVDALLPDGSRLHVVIPDITRAHWSINIRKFVVRAHHLDELVEIGSLSVHAAAFLAAAVAAGLNIVVAGGTQAGGTQHVDGGLGPP